MVIRETVQIGEEGSKRTFIHNYSNAGFMITRNGKYYEDALDPVEFAESRIYTETDIPIEE